MIFRRRSKIVLIRKKKNNIIKIKKMSKRMIRGRWRI
jgi:hypothetical protein